MAVAKTAPAAHADRAVPPAEARRQVLLFALSKYAAKESLREALPDAEQVDVEVEVNAKIKGRPCTEAFAGRLSVGAPTTKNSSTACDANHLVAYLLGQLDERQRARIVGALPEHFAAHAALPDVGTLALAEAKNLLERLRTKTPIEAAGAVSLSYAKPA